VKFGPVHLEIFNKIRRTTTWQHNAISIRIFSSKNTGPIFTKILHDLVALVAALFNLAHIWRYPIPFLNDRAISAGGRQFCLILPLNWSPWQRPLRYRKKKVGLIICHSIPTIRCKDCENQSSGSWDTSAPSERVQYETKLVVMATSLEILKKKFRSIIYTQKAFIWCKNCKNRTRFVFCLRHKIGCHGNVPWGIWKKWTWSRKFTQIPSIWWKFRENRSSRYWDSFAPSKKKKKLRKVKYIARSASLPCGLNNEQLIVYVLCARLVPPSGDSECTRHLVTYIHSRKGSFSSYDLELWTSQWNLTWSRYGEDEPACQLSIRWNICSDTNDETQTHTPNRFL